MSGCCLTVVAVEPGRFSVDVVPETLSRTTSGTCASGDAVNLERPLTLEQRLGGHLVQGHVDGVGEVLAVVPEGDGVRVTIAIPPPLRALRGREGLDRRGRREPHRRGAREDDRCEVALIPHTLEVTTAGGYARGTPREPRGGPAGALPGAAARRGRERGEARRDARRSAATRSGRRAGRRSAPRGSRRAPRRSEAGARAAAGRGPRA